MSARWQRDSQSSGGRRRRSADRRHVAAEQRHAMAPTFSADAAGLKTSLSSCEENFPSAVPVLLDVVSGPDLLPADDEFQEMFRGKLRILQADSSEVDVLLAELEAQLVTVVSEEKLIYVTFKSFEEIWKFSTYYTTGFLTHCLEDLIFDQTFWLSSSEEDVRMKVSLDEETLDLFYKGLLMQEGSWFASCSSRQMFDSCTSGGDLYLEQGDIAQFEPPFLGSGWTVLSLADGARGTTPHPALEPVGLFHQWFLKSCSENILVGDGKPSCLFPLQFASGVCEATQDYDSEGPDELSLASGERVVIVGFLAACFHWFTGRKETTGAVGLVKTSLVKPSSDLQHPAGYLDGDEPATSDLPEEEVIKESVALLKKGSVNESSLNFKLDVVLHQEKNISALRSDLTPAELKKSIRKVLDQRVEVPDQIKEVPADCKVKNHEVPPAGAWNRLSFTVQPVLEGTPDREAFAPLFSFLEGAPFREELSDLYDLSPGLFQGHSDHDQLVAFLSVARETARVRRLFWTQTRLCFLLGKLCAGRSKFSQARVYLEEALSVPREPFADRALLSGIYSQLASVYLLQKNVQSFFGVSERLAGLLLGAPGCLRALQDDCVLRYMLKKSVLSHNRPAESRACRLLAEHHRIRGQEEQAVPYLERLLVLSGEAGGNEAGGDEAGGDEAGGDEAGGDEAGGGGSVRSGHGCLTLGRLYGRMKRPGLSLSCARRAAVDAAVSLRDCLRCLGGVLEATGKREASDVPRLVPYIRRALALTRRPGGSGHWRGVLNHGLTVCLCRLLHKQRLAGRAVGLLYDLLRDGPQAPLRCVSQAERSDTLLWMAWLHVEEQQPLVALDILDSVLDSLPEHCTTPLEGAVLNMRGVALRCVGDLQGAAESYEAAAVVCQEYEDMANWAVAQANLGLLCLKRGADEEARRHLMEAVQLFSELSEEEQGGNFITVLLELGQHYVRQQQLHYGKGCYEWALLLAIRANRLDCQLRATGHLVALYGCECPDQAQSVVYSQHQVQLLRAFGDRQQEGDALVAISQLYLSMGTPRAFQEALDHTKSSLALFIDLGCRQKEAYGWLQAGRIYLLLGQTELVDIYVQAALDVALSSGDTDFVLKFLEAAGDVFFNGNQDRDKAVEFYRDRALPMAEKSGSDQTRLRLCNKLTEALIQLRLHEEAVEFAQLALDISVRLGQRLSERVASHRLAWLFQRLEKHEMAEHFYLKSLSLCPAPLQFGEETLYYVSVYQTLGDIMFQHLKDPFDAAGYYSLALAAAMDLGNKKSQLHLCTRLATIYHNFLGDRELSLFFYQRARLFAAELNVKRVNISSELRGGVGVSQRYRNSGRGPSVLTTAPV